MANEIKARLVLDTSGMAGVGAAAGGGGTGFNMGTEFRRALEGLDMPVLGDIGAAVAGMTVFLSAILKGITGFFKFVASSSPIFATSINLLKKSLQVLLRPIGDIMGLFLKPLAIAMLRFAIPIYKKWREFLQLGSTQEGLKDVNEGAGKVGAGIIALDFGMVKEGLMEMAGGIKEVASGFLSFMGTETKDLGERLIQFFSDAWDYFNGVFEPIMTWIGEKVEAGLNWAWETFWDTLSAITPESWNEKLESMKGALESIWSFFSDSITTWWDTPFWFKLLGPLGLAAIMVWEGVVEPMMDALVKAMDDKLPGLRNALEFLFKPKEEEGGGFLKSWVDNANELDNKILQSLNPALGMIWTTVETAIGRNKNAPEGTVIGSMNATAASIIESNKEVVGLTKELDNIPRDITTTHTINRIIKTTYR